MGFEDTPRGIEALLKTEAKPVLITPTQYEGIPDHVARFDSFATYFVLMLERVQS